MLRIDMLVAFVGLGNRQACMLALICNGLLLLEGLGVRGLCGGPRALVLTRGQAGNAGIGDVITIFQSELHTFSAFWL